MITIVFTPILCLHQVPSTSITQECVIQSINVSIKIKMLSGFKVISWEFGFLIFEVRSWLKPCSAGFSFSSVQFSSVAQSCPTLRDPMNRSTPGLPVHHKLPEFTQTHVHWVGDAIQPSHSLSSPSPPAPNPSQHQSLFQWVNSLHEVAKVSTGVSALASFLPKKSQGSSPSECTGWISLQSKGL